MPVRFKCDGCGTVMSAPDGSEGKKARCPKCGQTVVISPAGAGGQDAFSPAGGGASDMAGPGAFDGPAPAKSGKKLACPICGSAYKPGRPCPNCSQKAKGAKPARDDRDTGKIIRIAIWGTILAAILGGIIYAAGWVFKRGGETVEQYGTGLAGAQNQATDVSCEMNMSNLWKEILQFDPAGDGLPESLQEMVRKVGTSPAQFRCSQTRQDFVYIAGQSRKSPPTNVLIYEEKAHRDGKACLLRVSGQVQCLSFEQVQSEAAATRKQLGGQ